MKHHIAHHKQSTSIYVLSLSARCQKLPKLARVQKHCKNSNVEFLTSDTRYTKKIWLLKFIWDKLNVIINNLLNNFLILKTFVLTIPSLIEQNYTDLSSVH